MRRNLHSNACGVLQLTTVSPGAGDHYAFAGYDKRHVRRGSYTIHDVDLELERLSDAGIEREMVEVLLAVC